MKKDSRKKVLVLALSGIGNFIMQSPIFEAIKKEKPNWHITVWVVPRGTKELAENNPYIDEVIEVEIKASPFQHFKHVFYLARQKFDIGIVLSPGQLWKSAAYLWLAGIKTRVGSRYPWRGNSQSEFLLTDAVTEKNFLHDVELNLNLLKPLGIKYKTSHYQMSIPKKNHEKAERILSDLNILGEGKLIGFHMGCAPDFLAKRWPLARFIAVGKELAEKYDARILLFGGPGEELLKKEVRDGIGKKAHEISESLLTTTALMKKCEYILTNDSGLMHIAAASGVKTYAMFGPTHESKTGPRGQDVNVIRAENTVPVYDTENNYYLGEDPHPSILAITVDQVLRTIK